MRSQISTLTVAGNADRNDIDALNSTNSQQANAITALEAESVEQQSVIDQQSAAAETWRSRLEEQQAELVEIQTNHSQEIAAQAARNAQQADAITALEAESVEQQSVIDQQSAAAEMWHSQLDEQQAELVEIQTNHTRRIADLAADHAADIAGLQDTVDQVIIATAPVSTTPIVATSAFPAPDSVVTHHVYHNGSEIPTSARVVQLVGAAVNASGARWHDCTLAVGTDEGQRLTLYGFTWPVKLANPHPSVRFSNQGSPSFGNEQLPNQVGQVKAMELIWIRRQWVETVRTFQVPEIMRQGADVVITTGSSAGKLKVDDVDIMAEVCASIAFR